MAEPLSRTDPDFYRRKPSRLGTPPITEIATGSSNPDQYLRRAQAGFEGGFQPGDLSLAKRGEPRAMRRVASQQRENVAREEDALEEAARQAAAEAKAEEQAQSEILRRQQAIQKRMVERMEDQGMRFETDIATGEKVPQRDERGRPQWEPGEVGEAFKGPGGQWYQRYRNNIGAVKAEPITPKEDSDTGELYIEREDEFGKKVRERVGVNEQTVKINRLEKQIARAKLQQGQVTHEKNQILPQWEDAKTAYEQARKAQKELDEKTVYVTVKDEDGTYRWKKKGQGDTYWPVPANDPGFHKWQQEKRIARERVAELSPAYHDLKPQMTFLEKREREAKLRVDQLELERSRAELGMDEPAPFVERGAAKARARQALPPEEQQVIEEQEQLQAESNWQRATGEHPDQVEGGEVDPEREAPEEADAALQANPEEQAARDVGRAVTTGDPLFVTAPKETLESTLRDKVALAGDTKLNVSKEDDGDLRVRWGRYDIGRMKQTPDGGPALVIQQPDLAGKLFLGKDLTKSQIPSYIGVTAFRAMSDEEFGEVMIDARRILGGMPARSEMEQEGEGGAAEGAGKAPEGAQEGARAESPLLTPDQKEEALTAILGGNKGEQPDEAVNRLFREGRLSDRQAATAWKELYGQDYSVPDWGKDEEFSSWLSKKDQKVQNLYRTAKSKGDKNLMGQIERAYLQEFGAAYYGHPLFPREEFKRAYAKAAGAGTAEKLWTGAAGVAGSLAGLVGGAAADYGIGWWDAATFADENRGLAHLRKRWKDSGLIRGMDYWSSRLTDKETKQAFEQVRKGLDEVQRDIDIHGGANLPTLLDDLSGRVRRLNQTARGMGDLNDDRFYRFSESRELASILNGYRKTADPQFMGALREHVLSDPLKRRLEEEAALDSDEEAAARGFFGRTGEAISQGFKAGTDAPVSEFAIEAAVMAATWGAGNIARWGGKAAKGALRNLERSTRSTTLLGKATRWTQDAGRKARNVVQRDIDTLTARKGLVTGGKTPKGSLGSKAKKIPQFAISGVGEGLEEVLAEMQDPTGTAQDFGWAFAMGFLGGPSMVAAGLVPKSVERMVRPAIRNRQARKFAGWYNEALADEAGFRPITPEQAEIAQALVYPGNTIAIAEEAQAAKASREQIEQSFNDLLEEYQAGKITDERFRAVVDGLNREMSENTKTFKRLEREWASYVTAPIEAVNELNGITDPASREFYQAAVKAQVLGEHTLTGRERRTLYGRMTDEGQDFWEESEGGVPRLTRDALEQIDAEAPTLGRLLRGEEPEITLPDEEQAPEAEPGEPAETQVLPDTDQPEIEIPDEQTQEEEPEIYLPNDFTGPIGAPYSSEANAKQAVRSMVEASGRPDSDWAVKEVGGTWYVREVKQSEPEIEIPDELKPDDLDATDIPRPGSEWVGKLGNVVVQRYKRGRRKGKKRGPTEGAVFVTKEDGTKAQMPLAEFLSRHQQVGGTRAEQVAEPEPAAAPAPTAEEPTPAGGATTPDPYADREEWVEHFREVGLPDGMDAYDAITARPELRGMSNQERVSQARRIVGSDMGAKARKVAEEMDGLWDDLHKNPMPRVTAILPSRNWNHFEVGQDFHRKGEPRYKTYVTLPINDALKLTKGKMKGFMEALVEAGYDGQLKVSRTGSRLIYQFDNIVLHGADQANASLAGAVASEFFGEVAHIEKGEDGPRMSHSQLLEERLTFGEPTPEETAAPVDEGSTPQEPAPPEEAAPPEEPGGKPDSYPEWPKVKIIPKDWTELTEEELPTLKSDYENYFEWSTTVAKTALPEGTDVEISEMRNVLRTIISNENSKPDVEDWQHHIIAKRVAAQLLTGERPDVVKAARQRALELEAAMWETSGRFEGVPISVEAAEVGGLKGLLAGYVKGWKREGEMFVPEETPAEPSPEPAGGEPAQTEETPPPAEPEPAPAPEVEEVVEPPKEPSDALKKEEAKPPAAVEGKPMDPKIAKEQKKYLLDAIKEAIKDATEAEDTLEDFPDMVALREIEAKHKGKDAKAEAAADLMVKYQIPETNSSDKPLPKAERLAMLRRAIEKAHFGGISKVVIEVPGDGEFTIANNKEALREFEARAKKFPTTKARPNTTPGTGPKNPTAVPATPKKVDERQAFRTMQVTASTDPTRRILHYTYSNGEELVSTDGRSLLRVAYKGPGTKDAPVLISPTGKKIPEKEVGEKDKDLASGAEFPNYKSAIPRDEVLNRLFKGLDTSRLWQALKQATTILKPDVGDKAATPTNVTLYFNPDGTMGFHAANPGIGEFEYNLQGAELPIADYDANRLLNAVKAARWIGHEKLDLYLEDSMGGMILRAPGFEHVLMPMAVNRSSTGTDNRFSKILGWMQAEAEHGTLPEGVSLSGPAKKQLGITGKRGSAKKKGGGKAGADVATDQARDTPGSRPGIRNIQKPESDKALTHAPRTPIGLPDEMQALTNMALSRLLRLVDVPLLAASIKQGNVLGMAVGKIVGNSKHPEAVRLREKIFQYPELARMVLAHEIGHIIDYLAANVIGPGLAKRLAPLGDYENVFPFFSSLPKTKAGDPSVQALEDRIKAELRTLSMAWRGDYDPAENSYRDSAPELYADFMSALFNDPAWTASVAPESFQALDNAIDQKPAFATAYHLLQSMIANDQLAEMARSDSAKARAEGQRRIMEDIKRRKAVMNEKKRVLTEWQEEDINRFARARQIDLERGRELESVQQWEQGMKGQWNRDVRFDVLGVLAKADLSIDDLQWYLMNQRIARETSATLEYVKANPDEVREMMEFAFEKLRDVAPGWVTAWEGRIAGSPDATLYKELAKATFDLQTMFPNAEDALDGLVQEAIQSRERKEGFAIRFEKFFRAWNVRGFIANPAGITAEDAVTHLREMRNGMGPDKFRNLQSIAQNLTRNFHSLMVEALRHGLISPELYNEKIAPNADNYVPFQVAHYFSPGDVQAKIHVQKGTDKDIVDIVSVMTIQAHRWITRIARQREATLLKSIAEVHGLPLTVQKLTRYNMRSHAQNEILWFDEGKAYAVRFPKGQLRFAVETYNRRNQVGSFWNHAAAATGWYKMIWTKWNLGFTLFRSPLREVKNVFNRGGFRGLGQFFKPDTWKDAWNYAAAVTGHANLNGRNRRRVIDTKLLEPGKYTHVQHQDSPYAAAFHDDPNLEMLASEGHARGIMRMRPLLPGKVRPAFDALMGVLNAPSISLDAIAAATDAVSKIAVDNTLKKVNAKRIKKGKDPMTKWDLIEKVKMTALSNPGAEGGTGVKRKILIPFWRTAWQGLRAQKIWAGSRAVGFGFTVRVTATTIIPKALMWAAATGLIRRVAAEMFGEGSDEEKMAGNLQRFYNYTPEYQKANEFIIPLFWVDGEGEIRNLTEDPDEIGRSWTPVGLRIVPSDEERILGPAAWAVMKQIRPEDRDMRVLTRDLMAAFVSNVPSAGAAAEPGLGNPALQAAIDAAYLSMNRNPPDFYRRQGKFREDEEFRVRPWSVYLKHHFWEALPGWQADVRLDREDPAQGIQFLRHLQPVTGVFSITGSSGVESYAIHQKEEGAVRMLKDKAKLELKDVSPDAYQFLEDGSWIKANRKANERTLKQQLTYQAYRAFYNNYWNPGNKGLGAEAELMKAIDEGDKDRARQVAEEAAFYLNRAKQEVNQFKAAD